MHGIKSFMYINSKRNIKVVIIHFDCIEALRYTSHTITNVVVWYETKLTLRNNV